MTTDIRALITELVEALEGRRFNYGGILDRARTALDEPEPPRRNFVCGYQPRPSIGTHNPPPRNP